MKPSENTIEGAGQQPQSHIPRLQRSASLRLNGEHSFSKRPNSLCSQKNIPPKIPCGLWRLNHKLSECGDSLRGQTPSEPTSPDDDKSSVKSFGSGATFMTCDLSTHQHLESPHTQSRDLNKKYVLHCQRHIQTLEEYLTPTQRKDRQIRQLRVALHQAQRACEEKETRIDSLRSEIEELHLVLSQSNDDESKIEDEVEDTKDINHNITQMDSTLDDSSALCPSQNEQNSLEDSGILTDLTENKGDLISQNKDEMTLEKNEVTYQVDHASPGSRTSCCQGFCKEENNNSETDKCQHKVPHNSFLGCYNGEDNFSGHRITGQNNEEKYCREDTCCMEEEKRSTVFNIKPLADNFTLPRRKMYLLEEDNLVVHYEREVEHIKRQHAVEYQELKEKYNDRIENLLQKLSEANARYLELRPAFDSAQDRIRQLESQLENTRKEMAAQEDWHKQMYLKMYRKGQEAAKFEHADEVLEFAHRAPKRVSVPELLQQLHSTERELEQIKQMYRCELYQQATKGDGQESLL